MKNHNDRIIKLMDIQKTYLLNNKEKLEVLRGINLEVWKKEIVVIMGPSGSGKSTLLNIIGLLDNFDFGSYILGGVNVSNLTNKEKQKVRLNKIGFVFQTFNLIPTLTVQENVEIPLALQKVSQLKQKKSSNQKLKIVGLEDKLDKYPHQISIGEQQRVAIARALVSEPPLVLADEPTGELDYENMENIMELILTLHKTQSTTFLIVSHDLNLKEYGDRVLYLKKGVINET